MTIAGGAFMAHAAMHAAGSALNGPINALKVVSNMGAPLEYPTANDLINLHVKQFIDDGQFAQGMRRVGVRIYVTPPAGYVQGIAETLWVSKWLDAQRRQDGADLFEVANRQYWDQGLLKGKLVANGWYDPAVRDAEANLRYDIPGPSDLVRFSVRHVWEPDLVKALDYDKEFPGPIIDMWHAMKGLDYPLFTDAFKQQVAAHAGTYKNFPDWPSAYAFYGLPEPTWAKAYWWSHWILPSPGQFFEMLIRLDPNRDKSFDSPEMVGLDFYPADYDLGLRANDYPPKYRKMLAAINRPIVGVRFLRGLVHEGVYDYDAVIEWARRWGYSPRDQKDIADLIFLQEAAAGQKKSVCKGCATCDAAFEVGIVDQAQLDACYQGYGANPFDAQRMAAQASTKLQVRRAREMVANIRKRFLRGSLSEQEARGLMGQFGIVLQRQDQYIIDWRLEFEAGQKEISAAHAVRLRCKGLISDPELRLRLTNLKYDPLDVDLQVQEANACAGALALQLADRQARSKRQQQADAYTDARRKRMSLMEAQRYLASHGSAKQLKEWFCAGVIGEPEVFTRLNALGWPDIDIGRFLSDCKSGRKPSGLVVGVGAVVPPLVPQTGQAQQIENLP